MSCLVKTTTPFISKEILLEALEKCGYKYEIHKKVKSGALYKVNGQYVIGGINIPVGTSISPECIYIEKLAANFIFENGKYILEYEKDLFLESFNKINISSFLKKLESSYNNIYEMKLKRLREIEKEKAATLERERLAKEKEEAKRLERERIERQELEKLERERIAYIESQKKAIMEKAKAKGYRVMEVKKDKKIQLTLVREVR